MMNLLQPIEEALHYTFMQRALIAGCFIALGCSFLGPFLVLRRFSLIGDGLAHVSFATVAIALLLHAQPMLISIPLVGFAAVLILKLNTHAQIYGDAAIGLISAFAVALGVIITSTAGGFNVDLFSYLFGSILAISYFEVWMSIAIAALIIVVVTFFYHDLFVTTFDEEYAQVLGISVQSINHILVVLTALLVVAGVQIVGTLLISSLIILPAISALQIARSFRVTLALASVFAMASVIIGLFVSYYLNYPSGATIVMVNFIFFGSTFYLNKRNSILSR
jgi:zinc transport system permease protein